MTELCITESFPVIEKSTCQLSSAIQNLKSLGKIIETQCLEQKSAFVETVLLHFFRKLISLENIYKMGLGGSDSILKTKTDLQYLCISSS